MKCPKQIWLLLLPLLAAACATNPPKTIRLPVELNEASGLAIHNGVFVWHNDSGDGPYLYWTDETGEIFDTRRVAPAASDFEDLTRDPKGRYYVGDFGNNRGKRTVHTIYHYDSLAAQIDSIVFRYPEQAGLGIGQAGEYNCEAMVFENSALHLFTKNQVMGRGDFYTYHYRLPAQPGEYVAELVDSLYLPRRVITAAAVDSVRQQLVLTAYNFNYLVGKVPTGSASLITITDYPEGRYLRGKIHRRNLSWAWPTQFEAIDFYDDKWLYVASEATKFRKYAVAKRKRRR